MYTDSFFSLFLLLLSPRRLPFTKQTKLAQSFFLNFFLSNSVLLSISVFMALSTLFHSINPPDNSPLFYSVLPVLFLP